MRQKAVAITALLAPDNPIYPRWVGPRLLFYATKGLGPS